MTRRSAALGSAVFFAIAPGAVGGLVPWSITRGRVADAYWLPQRIAGWALIVVGAAAMIRAFVRFTRDGLGTPAPIAPTTHLVVTGAYRYVRNPMYLARLAAIIGQALARGQAILFAYALLVWATVWAFVAGYEQPTLARQFGPEYDAYRRAVPGWWPGMRPWEPPS